MGVMTQFEALAKGRPARPRPSIATLLVGSFARHAIFCLTEWGRGQCSRAGNAAGWCWKAKRRIVML